MYDFDEVQSQHVNFPQDTFFLQFDYQDTIGTWLQNSFMVRYPLHSILHILHYVNEIMDNLILSIFYHFLTQLWWLIFLLIS